MNTIPQSLFSSRNFGIAASWGGFAFAFAVAANAATPIDERISAAAEGTVRIENLAGSVAVQGSDMKEVVVTGLLGEGAKEVRVESVDGVVVVQVVLPKHAEDVEETELLVQVPAGSNVDVETVSASIAVEGVLGEQELTSVSGSIECTDATGGLAAETVSGSIRAEGGSDTVEAESVSGSIQIADGKFENVKAQTVSGSITFDADLEKNAAVEIESTSGAVRARFSDRANADVAIETFSGSISTEFDAKVVEPQHGPGRSCAFEIGDGGSRVKITNLSGGVSVGKRVARS